MQTNVTRTQTIVYYFCQTYLWNAGIYTRH